MSCCICRLLNCTVQLIDVKLKNYATARTSSISMKTEEPRCNYFQVKVAIACSAFTSNMTYAKDISSYT
jgi:hypothetical protein